MSIDIDDINSYDSELDTVVDSLIAYLQTKERLGKSIDRFYNQWPEANEGEFEKVLSCHTVSVGHSYTMPTLVEKLDVTGDAVKVAALYRVGMYDIDLQLDIWCSYKAQRNQLYKQFYEIMNEDMITKDGFASGLSLTLVNYFDTIARYDIVGYTFPDDERSSQEDDWRVKIDLKVHFDKKVQKQMSKIVESIIVDGEPIVDANDAENEVYISETIIIE